MEIRLGLFFSNIEVVSINSLKLNETRRWDIQATIVMILLTGFHQLEVCIVR